MRVIAGKYKGHRLVSFSDSRVRPMTDRVKETLFNKIQSFIEEAKVLDLFSGTGNLGIEALSRGAKTVTSVENSSDSIKIISKNLKKLKIDNGFFIEQKDVFEYIKKTKDVFDIIFIDPPFVKKIAHRVMEAISQKEIATEGGLIIIESIKQEPIEDEYKKWILLDRKNFGDKNLSFYKLKESI